MDEEKVISQEEMNDFVIEEPKKFDLNDYDLTSSDDIIDFDFKSDEVFDIEGAYELISKTNKPKETKEFVEQREADNVVMKTAEKYLSSEYVEKMKIGYDNLLGILKRYNVNSDLVKGMKEEEKDKIYGIAEYLFNEYQKNLNHMNFNFELTQDEWKFMMDVLNNKLEYDQNEVFQMDEIRKQYLDGAVEIYKSLPKSMDVPTVINVNNLIILYHIISKYKVKGINKSHYAFLSLLTKIGERIKLFNAYTVWVQRLSNDFQVWGGSLSIDIDGEINTEKESN